MKTVALISFTQNGAKVGERLEKSLNAEYSFHGFVSSRFVGESSLNKNPLSLTDWTREWFAKADCLVFVGACGIAVRAISPFVKDKFADPAVIVIDEQGKFCISLLSGHMGGANAFAETFAALLGAQPIVTTATDLNEKFAVDLFAKQNRLIITNRVLAKDISSALLAGKKIAFKSDFPFVKALPKGLVPTWENADSNLGIVVSFFRPQQENVLWLIPQNLVLGIGCRKDTPKESIEQLVNQVLFQYGLPLKAAIAVASIDLKAKEQGLLQFCKEHGLSFVTYPASELAQLDGEFSPSAFVRGVTGVDNVCERSAVMKSGGSLLIKKQKGNGVTLAVAANCEQINLVFDI